MLLWVSEVGTDIPECRAGTRRTRDSVPVIPLTGQILPAVCPVSSVYLLKKEA